MGALSVCLEGASAAKAARSWVLAESAMASEASEPPKEEPTPEPVRAAAPRTLQPPPGARTTRARPDRARRSAREALCLPPRSGSQTSALLVRASALGTAAAGQSVPCVGLRATASRSLCQAFSSDVVRSLAGRCC